MEKLLREIIIAILIEQNGYTEAEAKTEVYFNKGSEIWERIDKILQERLSKMIEFTKQMAKLEKGCAPSVGLMDTRIDIAINAIRKFND